MAMVISTATELLQKHNFTVPGLLVSDIQESGEDSW